MIDVLSFNKSLKASWIKKYLDSENSSKWKTIFNLELGKYGGIAFFKGNLKKDIDKLSMVDPFVKEIIEIWSDTFFEGKIVSKDRLLSLPLWQNSLIRINEGFRAKRAYIGFWPIFIFLQDRANFSQTDLF